jgi:malonate transporter and related proteins
MANTIFLALFPAVFGVALGWIAARMGYLKRDYAPAFGAFVIKFALPFALLAGMTEMPIADMPSSRYILCLVGGFVGIYAVAVILGRSLFKNDLASSALQGLVCAFPSMAFSGVPILTSVVGSRSVIPIIVGNLVTSFILIPLTLVLVEIGLKSKDDGASASPFDLLRKSIVHSIKEPIVWLPVLGGIIRFSGIPFPKAFLDTAVLIGNASAGVGLFVVGLMLYGTKLELSTEVVTNTVLKNIAQPLLIAGMVPLCGLAAVSHSRELILTGAIPVASTSSILALRYQRYVPQATAAIVASTVFSVVTIALAIVITR